MVIGLTGKYCSGKNAAAQIFDDKKIPSIDVDKLGHQALAANTERIESEFGSRVISIEADGSKSVDRKALGSIVFSDPAQLAKLEAISHPWMKQETARLVSEMQAQGSSMVIINAAILYKMELDQLCDCIIWIEAPLLKRIKRARKRDSAGLFDILKRIYSQRELHTKPSEKSVDIYRVENKSDLEALRLGIESVLYQIEQKGRDGR